MSNTPTRRLRGIILALLAAFVVFASVAACVAAPGGTAPGSQSSAPALATRKPTATRVKATATRTPRKTVTATPKRRATATPDDGLLTISFDKLPREAQQTIRLIRQGGPFPYDKDGSTFGNREGLLPKRPNGYYKEYTVITPGSRDRGARRIVAGREGELYYTDDHYDSFKRVVE